MIVSKPAFLTCAMPSSRVENVFPSERSGVWTTCPAARSPSANERHPEVSPSAWWNISTSAMERAVYRGSGLDRVDQPVFLAAADLRVEPLGSVVVVSGLPGHLGEPSSAALLPARSKQRPRSAGAAMRLDDVQVVHDADPLPGERAPGEVDRGEPDHVAVRLRDQLDPLVPFEHQLAEPVHPRVIGFRLAVEVDHVYVHQLREPREVEPLRSPHHHLRHPRLLGWVAPGYPRPPMSPTGAILAEQRQAAPGLVHGGVISG